MGNEKEFNPSKWKVWFKRFGLAGFLFFLAKGLVWVGVAVMAVYAAKD